MPDEMAPSPETLALSTKLEEDFISPLTAVRGALEILRDFPDLEAEKRRHFVERALEECARLEKGISDLATTVYAAGRRGQPGDSAPPDGGGLASRLSLDTATGIMELDFSDFEFSSSALVDDYFDLVDRAAMSSGRQWYVLVNLRNCHVWPEAWIAFAHRGRKINVNYSLGTVRYVDAGGEDDTTSADRHAEPSREAALTRIDEMKRAAER